MWESMDVVLQKHGAKYIYEVPEGLRELCSDISREVLRSQPTKIYQFIADYVNALLITRENTKVAVQVVNNILRGSQAIVNILFQTRLSLEQIVAVAPRVQKAFRKYLDAVDQREDETYKDCTCDENSRVLLQNMLEATGATEIQANRAATVIQAAFRGHYERMKLNEAKGLIMWQRAVGNTLDILKKAGVPQAEIIKTAPLIQFAYRGYYARRNIKIMESCQPVEEPKVEDVVEPRDTLQAVAWLDMMFEDSGLTVERANEAAYIIQRAYRRYRVRKTFHIAPRVESTRSMVVEAIVETLRQRIFQSVMSRTDIPTEHGSREEMERTGSKLQIAYKEHIRRSRLSVEDSLANEVYEREHEEGEDERTLDFPVGEEAQSETEQVEEEVEDVTVEKPKTLTDLKMHVEEGRTDEEIGDEREGDGNERPNESQQPQEEQRELELYEDEGQDEEEREEQDPTKSHDEQHKERDWKGSHEQ